MMIRCLLGGLALVLLLIGGGCSGQPERANVKGKVTIGDKPLTAGSVMFYGKDGLSGSAAISKDGNYDLGDAPLGEVKVTVSVPKPPPGGMEAMHRMKNNPGAKNTESVDPNDPSKRIGIMGDIPTDYVAIPEKYSKPETSGLTYTVQRGDQTHDIKLTE
jgi:hypothetical protein